MSQVIRRPNRRRKASEQAVETSGRAYAYTRASTQMQVEDGETLGVQDRMIAGYAMMKSLAVERTFEERAVSGGKPFATRPAASELLDVLEPGDTVICAKLNRAFRDLEDAIETLRMFRARGVDFHLLDLGGSVTEPGIAELTFSIMAAVAQFERYRIRERISDDRADKAARGIYAGGRRPFGWDVVGEEGDERRLVPNPAELAAIDEMRGLRAGVASLRWIAKRMSARGFPLSHTGVRRILDDWTGQPPALAAE